MPFKTTEIRWAPFEEKYWRAYLQFARQQFGESAYQASERYLCWLYKENPSKGENYSDFIIGMTKENEIIACIHKMRITWKVNGSNVDIPAIHNLMVTKEYRTGVGLMLIMAAFSGEEHALIPGTAMPVSALYQKLRCQKIDACWYRKVLTPIKGALSLGLHKTFGYRVTDRYFEFINSRVLNINSSYKITTAPNHSLMRKLVDGMNVISHAQAFPYWSVEQFHWRFFHPMGPRHVAIFQDSQESISNFMILSLGPRKGLNVGRVIAMGASSKENLAFLFKVSESIIKDLGGHVFLIFCGDSKMNNMMGSLKWGRFARPGADSFIFHKNRRPFRSIAFGAAAGDHGFEALGSRN